MGIAKKEVSVLGLGGGENKKLAEETQVSRLDFSFCLFSEVGEKRGREEKRKRKRKRWEQIYDTTMNKVLKLHTMRFGPAQNHIPSPFALSNVTSRHVTTAPSPDQTPSHLLCSFHPTSPPATGHTPTPP